MRRLKLTGTILTASFLLIGTIAAAEPATKQTTTKKHRECEGSKMKSACNQHLDVKEFVTGLQAPPSAPGPTASADQTANLRSGVQPATDGSAQPEQPKSGLRCSILASASGPISEGTGRGKEMAPRA